MTAVDYDVSAPQLEVHVIGDALAPRETRAVIAEALLVALGL
ncbi:hypothetical protein [Nonomuraea jabiensis]